MGWVHDDIGKKMNEKIEKCPNFKDLLIGLTNPQSIDSTLIKLEQHFGIIIDVDTIPATASILLHYFEIYQNSRKAQFCMQIMTLHYYPHSMHAILKANATHVNEDASKLKYIDSPMGNGNKKYIGRYRHVFKDAKIEAIFHVSDSDTFEQGFIKFLAFQQMIERIINYEIHAFEKTSIFKIISNRSQFPLSKIKLCMDHLIKFSIDFALFTPFYWGSSKLANYIAHNHLIWQNTLDSQLMLVFAFLSFRLMSYAIIGLVAHVFLKEIEIVRKAFDPNPNIRPDEKFLSLKGLLKNGFLSVNETTIVETDAEVTRFLPSPDSNWGRCGTAPI